MNLVMGDLTGYSDLDRIEIEKYLEGGISTRSLYYHYYSGLGNDADVGLAFTEIDPRAILGFDTYDAGVSHEIKQLRPTMEKKDISQIIRGKAEIAKSTHGEVAMLRYEYDISKIRKRYKWRKSSSRLYCT